MPYGITITFVVLFLTGIIIIILVWFIDKYIKKQDVNIDLTETDLLSTKQDSLIKTINDADDAIEQFNGISKHVFEKQEEKYQELLYLYQIIDEKKQELLEFSKSINLVKKDDIHSDSIINDTVIDNIEEKSNMDKTDEIDEISKIDKIDEKTKVEHIKSNIVKSNTKYDEIIKLYNSNMTVTQIARQLNIGQGEVNLVLELKKQSEEFNNG